VTSCVTQVFRQRDANFVRLLNQVRLGNGAAAVAELERQCSRPLPEVRRRQALTLAPTLTWPGHDPDRGPQTLRTIAAARANRPQW